MGQGDLKKVRKRLREEGGVAYNRGQDVGKLKGRG